MANVTRTTTWSDGQVLTAAALNGEFNNLLNNTQIVNADISATAAIATSKISFGGANHQVLTSNGSGGIAYLTPTGSGSAVFAFQPSVTSPVNVVSAISGGSPTCDLNNGNIFTITLGANTTFSVANASTGMVFIVLVQQGSGTTYTNTWFAGITWVTAGGTAPVQTTVSNGITAYGFVVTGAGTYDGFLVGTN